MENDEFTTYRLELEQVLVRQFRLLQEMIALTRKERAGLMGDPDLVLRIVEDKEVLLDRMSLLEDQCRKSIQDISLLMEMGPGNISIQSLLPFFKPDDASRIKNLSEGITGLAGQARELNRANQALALTRLDWLKATQSFLISIFQPEAGYRSPKSLAVSKEVTGLGVEFRA